jgi:serine/threonine protein kinase
MMQQEKHAGIPVGREDRGNQRCKQIDVSNENSPMLRASTRRRRPDPLLGTTIADKYKIIDKLGEGGMGTVYRAMQQPIDRLVAVKVLLNKLVDDDMAIRRFEQEARAVSKMQHPNTVTIYDYGQTEDGRFYLVMEFLKGKTLTDLLREDGPLKSHLTCHIIRQVCASLGEAHAAGIIHRDLKPDNIFLTTVGSDPNFVKVLDFGVAKLADNEAGATLTQTGMIFGTPKYMSPEQAEGKPIDFRADIYAIGVVMYELLAGRPPFLADTAVALLLKHISQPPPTFERIRADLQVPARLEAITMKALSKDVDARYSNVEELSEDLYQCMSSMSTGPIQAMGMSTQRVPVGGAVPTEMVPNQEVPASTGLVSPQAVPENLSLGVNPDDASTGNNFSSAPPAAATESAPMIHGATQPAPVPAAATEQHFAPPAAGIGSGDSTTPFSADALSPSNELFLDARHRQKRESKGMIYAGLGLLTAAVGILVVVSTRTPESQSVPLDSANLNGGALAPAADPKEDQAKPKTADNNSSSKAKNDDPSRVNNRVRNVKRTNRKNVGNKRTQNTAVATDNDKPVKAPAADNKVSFRFASSPPGAMVSIDGRQLGQTPFNTEFSKEVSPVNFVIELKGYVTKEVTASLARDHQINATLEKKPAPKKRNKTKIIRRVKKQPKPESDRIDDEGDPLNERVDELKDF